jgi:hypothetical protein
MRFMKELELEMKTSRPVNYTGGILGYLTPAVNQMSANRRSLVNDYRRDFACCDVVTVSATLTSLPFA